MALDLKPLSSEVIQNMGYTEHDLWMVKIDGEEFGPFEVASLTDYATENGKEFIHAHASLMDANDWQPFFSHEHFQPIKKEEEVIEERFWILNQGQKAGPFPRMTIDKKLEMGILAMSDMVSIDDGHTWHKFFQMEAFNPEGQPSGVDALPMAPLESSFARAKEELNEWMDNHERTGSHAGLASLVYLGQKNENKTALKLEEMDLKSLEETEVSKSLKWVVPSAVAGVAVVVALGNFILTPSNEMDMTASSEKSEVIMPKRTTASVPIPSNRPGRNPSSANYNQYNQRSGLTAPPSMHNSNYPSSHVETHYNDPDPMIDQPQDDQPQEQSLVQNNMNQVGGDSLDQAMSPGIDGQPEAAPDTPVIEEAADF